MAIFFCILWSRNFQCNSWPHHNCGSLLLTKWMRECKHDYFDYTLCAFFHHLVSSTIHQPLRCTIYGVTTENTSMERHNWAKDIICSQVFHHWTSMKESDKKVVTWLQRLYRPPPPPPLPVIQPKHRDNEKPEQTALVCWVWSTECLEWPFRTKQESGFKTLIKDRTEAF